MPSYVVTGWKELDRKLRRMDAAVGRKIVRQSIRAEMKQIQTEMKVGAPRGVTGNLRRSIRLKAMRRSRKGFGYNVILSARAFPRPEKKLFYPPFVERGTHKTKRKQKAQFFMKKVFDKTKKGAIDHVRELIRARIYTELEKDIPF